MSLLITTSTDITDLKVPVTFNLSGAVPVVKIENSNAGANLGLVKLVFELYDPNGQPIHIGNFTTPDALGNFTDYTFTEPLPLFDNSILWSGTPYKLIVKARDSANKDFSFEQPVNICKPAGNTNVGKNYAEALILVKVDCNQAHAKITDATNYAYKGLTGEVVEKKLTVITPTDPTGTTPQPTVYMGLTVVLHPLQFNAKGYQAVLSSKIKYDLSNGTGDAFVIFNYVKWQSFDVTCNYDLCPLLSEFGKLIEKANTKCDTQSEELIKAVSPKILNLILAREQATCGYDIGAMIEDIKKTAGWDCSCECNTNMGLNATGSQSGSLNVQFDVGGDIAASADVVGLNILIHVKDFTYVFSLGAKATSAGFTILPGINGRTKTFLLDVNPATLAAEILNTIKTNPTLLTAINQLISSTGNNLELNIDGRCVINTFSSCTYTWTKVLADATDYLLKAININGVKYNFTVPFTTVSNIAAIGTKLTSFGKGTFVSSYNAGNQTLTVVATNNNFSLDNLVFYKVVSGALDTFYSMDMNKVCGSSVPIKADVIIQSVFNYLCSLSTANVKLAGPISLCKINLDGTSQTIAYTGTLEDYLQAQAAQFCKAINLTLSKNGIACSDIKNLFTSTKPITALDVVYGSRSTECGPWSIGDLFKTIMSFVKTTNDATIKTLWCEAIAICNSGFASCSPVPAGSADYDGTNLNISWANNGAGNYKVGYRVWGTVVPFTTATYAASGGAGTTGTQSYVLPPNTYEVSIIAVCSTSESTPFLMNSQKCGAMTSFNVSSGTGLAFGNSFLIAWSVPAGVNKVNLVITYPNGGGYNGIIDAASGLATHLKPAGVYGDYTFKMRTVCNEATGWVGDFSNIVTTTVQPPFTFTNKVYYGAKISNLPLTKADIESSSNFVPVTGSNVTVDWSQFNAEALFVWFAEPLSEPLKTAYQDVVNLSNQGSIGSPSDWFDAPIEVESTYRFYIGNYETQVAYPITLKP